MATSITTTLQSKKETRRISYVATTVHIYAITPLETMDMILITNIPFMMCPMIVLQWESAIRLMRLMNHPRTRTILLDERFQFTVLPQWAIPMPNGNFKIMHFPSNPRPDHNSVQVLEQEPGHEPGQDP